MAKTIKIAVSIPEGTFKRAETLRAKKRESRSALYTQALESLFNLETVREAETRYEAGYRERPEDRAELEGLFKAGLSGLKKEDW
jgi:hypothetical protein